MLVQFSAHEVDANIQIGQATYKFTRQGNDYAQPLLCDVEDPNHAAELLSRPGFSTLPADAPEEGSHVPDAAEAAAYADMTYDELREEYLAVFGKQAHSQAKHETLLARLVEAAQKVAG